MGYSTKLYISLIKVIFIKINHIYSSLFEKKKNNIF